MLLQVCEALAAAETHYRQQYASDISAKRKQAAAAARAAELAKQMAEAAKRDGQVEGGSVPDGGSMGSTAVIDGIVFSIDEDETLPDPSFTFLKEDKARSEVGGVNTSVEQVMLQPSQQQHVLGMDAFLARRSNRIA